MERAYGLEIPQTLSEVCDPRRMALVVYDMQVGVLNQLDRAAEVTERVVEVLRAARDGGYRVIFLRHMSLPKELMGVFQFRMAMAWQRVEHAEDVSPWFVRDAPGFELLPELEPLESEAVLDKITMSAFEGTPLDIVLRDCGLVAFAIVGVATEIGIEPTVRHGADLGYIPVVVTDACGAGNEEAGRRSLDAIQFVGDALLTDTDTIGTIWHTRV
jgi:nicotinamidase-related amidase